MQKSIEMTGATRDIAIEKALEFLHMDRDDVSVEVLDNGKKGFLGIGATDAKIRVTYEVPDEEPVAAPAPAPQPEPEKEKEPEKKPAQTRPVFHDVAPDDPRLTTPHLVKAAPKGEGAPVKKEKKADKPRAPRAERAPRAPREERPSHPPIVPYIDPVPMEEDKIPQPAREAVQFIDGLLEKMDIQGKATVLDISEPDHVRIDIAGPDMGPVIGRRGDTLDAIQYLTSLVLNKNSEEHLRLTIDTENYRAKRAESLERLARKMAAKVSKYHKAMTLEPMNPYERRIIHASLQDFRGVTTYSTGTEPGRRVVIAPDGPVRPPRRGFQPRNNGKPRDGFDMK
ncbi:RNA-binding cell elongation regulator Jag/EloR [Intestinibacillus sp. Marseille-P6563]|uniref:RNA-binding cell elongation regulator Jag/EloR n=1 Tax=Intestinibacillus sp. Marseille-P6563 TaxID=2364792 RepID=UPI000F04D4A2|nr:RNA-binding cell elongation regulator Jag/EloR [Intestinibacillus sp. Marseille-P6563]